MLRKEGTDINLSFGLYLELMKCQTHLKRQMLHQQICNKLYAYHCIYSLSVSHSNFMYLKIGFEPSPKTFYTMMLLPYRYDLRRPELFAKHHNTINSLTIFEKQQQDISERWAYCFFSGYWNASASPSRFIKLNVLLMGREFLLFAIYCEDIIAFGMYQYSSESFFRKHINQWFGPIPAMLMSN